VKVLWCDAENGSRKLDLMGLEQILMVVNVKDTGDMHLMNCWKGDETMTTNVKSTKLSMN